VQRITGSDEMAMVCAVGTQECGIRPNAIAPICEGTAGYLWDRLGRRRVLRGGGAGTGVTPGGQVDITEVRRHRVDC
jgi:hypothetical protein